MSYQPEGILLWIAAYFAFRPSLDGPCLSPEIPWKGGSCWHVSNCDPVLGFWLILFPSLDGSLKHTIPNSRTPAPVLKDAKWTTLHYLKLWSPAGLSEVLHFKCLSSSLVHDLQCSRFPAGHRTEQCQSCLKHSVPGEKQERLVWAALSSPSRWVLVMPFYKYTRGYWYQDLW